MPSRLICDNRSFSIMTQESLTVNICWCANFGGTVVFFAFLHTVDSQKSKFLWMSNWLFWGLKCSLKLKAPLPSGQHLYWHTQWMGDLNEKDWNILREELPPFFSFDLNHLIQMSAIKITQVLIRLKPTTKKNKLVACTPGHTWNFMFSVYST